MKKKHYSSYNNDINVVTNNMASESICDEIPIPVIQYFDDRMENIDMSGEPCDVVPQKQPCFHCQREIDTEKKYKNAQIITIPNPSPIWCCVPTCDETCYDKVMDMANQAGVPSLKDRDFHLNHEKTLFKVRVVCDLPQFDDHDMLVYVKGVEVSKKRKRNPAPMNGIWGWVSAKVLKRV